jgi:hypothetical protein
MKRGVLRTKKVRIDDEHQEDSIAKIKAFSIGLLLDGELAGSGTLIRWGDEFGILTAYHVVHSPDDSARRFDFNSEQHLYLTVQEDPCSYWLPMKRLKCIDIGTPESASLGPDLSVLVLPKSGIGTLMAKKDFFHIEHRSFEKLKSALSNDGFFILIGNPEYETRLKHQVAGFREVLFTPAISIFGQPERRYNRGKFDFLEIPVGPRELDGAIPNFKGISGGGVWKFPITIIPRLGPVQKKVLIGEPVLAGSSFWQTSRRNGRRRLRCHGARSIYVHALKFKLRRLK